MNLLLIFRKTKYFFYKVEVINPEEVQQRIKEGKSTKANGIVSSKLRFNEREINDFYEKVLLGVSKRIRIDTDSLFLTELSRLD